MPSDIIPQATREQRLESALIDIAAERGRCSICKRPADMPSNCTPMDCDRRGCSWEPMDLAEVAREALANA